MTGDSKLKIEFRPPEEAHQMRIDKALTFCPQIVSRSQVQKLIGRKSVLLRGEPVKPSYLVQPEDIFEIEMPAREASPLDPYEFPLDILYEDQDLLVVNKPAGLVVHPANGHASDTLVNALIFHCKDLSLGFAQNRPGLVHRLDKNTSGTLVIAKNERAQVHLARQFEMKTAHRRYLAIVFGIPKTSEGTIRGYLARHPIDRKRFASVRETEAVGSTASGEVAPSSGKLAVTHYRLVSESNGFSLLELRLETGRTHQIRVHLSEMHHPVVGDETYGGVKRASGIKNLRLRKWIQETPRFALHARELGFVHPNSGETLLFTAPWPEDLCELLELTGLNLPDANSRVDP